MKKLFAVSAAAALFAMSSAIAADLPARSPAMAPAPVYSSPISYNWTGFYAGLHAGYGWGRFKKVTGGIFGKANGGVVGGQLGYNYQVNSFVMGVEADAYWSGMKGKRAFPGPINTSGSVSWAGSLRARAGFAADRALVYLTGGYAFASVKASVIDAVIPVTFTASGMRHGWTLGGGIEYAFTNNISAKAEYLYASYSSKRIFGAPYTTGSGLTTSIIRAGVNYHF